MVKAVPLWAWNNKFKTILIIVVVYLARKAWILYQNYVKPFLDIAKSLKGGETKKPQATPQSQVEDKLSVEHSDYYEEEESSSSSFYEDPQSVTPT